jgi:serine phosphatase RsbU (regulator of sigma subunit)
VKKYFATTSRKVLLMLYGASLLIGAAVILRSHRGEEKSMRDQTLSQLGAVTGTLSAQIEGNRITRLLDTYDSRGMLVKNTQDAWYYILHETLRKGAEAAKLQTPLAVVAYDTLKRELQTVATAAERPMLREVYHGAGAMEVETVLRMGAKAKMRLEGNGRLVAVDPVLDVNGRQVGALIASTPLAPLGTDAQNQLAREIVVATMLFLALGFFLIRRVGQLVRNGEHALSSLQQQHEGVTDSIAYAGKIQSALIPPPERYREQFNDFFVLNRPRDVVSGDFHWYHRISGHECLVATADCTGHGLPGAMMAAIGCSVLNDLAREMQHHDPALMLSELNRRLVAMLNQEGRRTGAGDGMDIALCRIDRQEREVLFAGAFRPLYWMHEGQLTVINGDRKPVGGSQHGPERSFSVHRIAYHPGDSLYLFSDGYVDQFGGPDRKKFMAARLNELLLANHAMPMAMQAEALERAFNDWKGNQPQVDDVCVLGIAV